MIFLASVIIIAAIVGLPAVLGVAFQSWMVWGVLGFVAFCMGFFNAWRSFGDLLSGVLVGLITGIGLIVVGFIYNFLFAASSPFAHLWDAPTTLSFPALNVVLCVAVGGVCSIVGGWLSQADQRKTKGQA